MFLSAQVNLANDHRYMPQVVSSAIVNAPPPEGVIKTLHMCSQAHKSVDKTTKVCCVCLSVYLGKALTKHGLYEALHVCPQAYKNVDKTTEVCCLCQSVYFDHF